MDDPTFKVSVSGYALNRKIPPGDPFWKDFNGSFQNKTLSCLELADRDRKSTRLNSSHRL